MHSGIELGASYIGDFFYIIPGGVQDEGTYLNNIIFDIGFDMGKLSRIDGMIIYLSGLGIYGGFPFENSGAIQGISNIAGVKHWTLYEVRIEQNLFKIM